MKRFRLLTLCFILISLCLLCSCDKEAVLDPPKGVEVEYDTLTLEWRTVEGANVYTVRIRKEDMSTTTATVSKNSYSLDTLQPGKYYISVTAVSPGGDVIDSLPSDEIEFVREEETGLVFKLINGGKEYEVVDKGSATGVITIPSEYRKKPVTSIGDNAFFTDSDITAVVLPESIKNIGEYAFAECSYLESINLPDGLSTLGQSAFYGCRKLSGVLVLPNSLSKIPESAFAYCYEIKEIVFGTGVKEIGNHAFTDCTDLEVLNFPSQLTSIGDFAFAACADITQVSFNQGLEHIGEFVFSKLVLLQSVILPESLKTLGSGAFYYCSSLSDVYISDDVESVGANAFLDTAIYSSGTTNEIYVGNWFLGLKDTTVSRIDIANGTVGIANNALYGNRYLRSVTLPDSVEKIGMLSFAQSQLVSVVTGSGIKHVGDQAFLACTNLVKVFLGSYDDYNESIKSSSLETIGDYAFLNCTMLESIEIPDTVKDIGAYAFRYSGIYDKAYTGVVYADNWLVDFNENIVNEVTVYSGTVGISRYAFYNCSILESITIPASVKTIGRGAFYSCTSLQRVSLPDTLSRIEDYTFYGCVRLSIPTLPPMLKEIGRSAFYACQTVKGGTDTDEDVLEIPSGVTYIGDYAFFGCGYRLADELGGAAETYGVDILIIGNNVEYIGKCAFYGFASLKSVHISGTALIGDKAFYKCPSLKEVRVDSKLSSVGKYAFYKCDQLENVVLPDSLEKIGDYAFYKCTSLTKIDLGASLENIGDYVFLGDKMLSDVHLPSTLVSIGTQSFRDCDGIDSLSLGRLITYVGDYAFYSCDNLTLYLDIDTNTSLWAKRWNATYCTLICGSDVVSEGSYVYSVTVNDGFTVNNFTFTTLNDPTREGYTFVGWSLTENADVADFSTADLQSRINGTILYSVWE